MMAATPEEQVVTIADIRVEKLCLRGARNWFENRPDDYTWAEFMAGKYTVGEMEATDDPVAHRVCRNARKRWALEHPDGR